MKWICTAAVALFISQAMAFEIDGSKWPGAETGFYVDMDGVAARGVSWDNAFIGAMDDWNNQTDFNFILHKEYRDPCGNDQVNGVDFVDDVCGTEFGDNVAAVTLRAWQTDILGPPKLVRADIAINAHKQFDVYDGFLFGSIDFRRVALHELGHALGLDHENQRPAIMAPNISNIYRLQDDDINGVNTLYGGLANCFIPSLAFGESADALQGGDCTVQLLTVGGEDDSFIDVRRLQLSSLTELSVTMRSETLDSVLLLADSKLRYIAWDDNSAGNCDATINQTLPAGTYYLLANTYDENTDCGVNAGTYQLSVSFVTDMPQDLGVPVSLKGGIAAAGFSGGITDDNGVSYGNRFSATDSLDISGRIEIDPLHQGKLGFLVVAGVIAGGETLLRNNQGQFVSYAGGAKPLIRAASKQLQAVEFIDVATDLVPLQLGISEINVDFFIGYGIDSNSQEVYYHQQPINLVIEQ